MKYVFVLTVAVAMALHAYSSSAKDPSVITDKECANCSDHCEIPAVNGKGSLTCVAESPSITNINCAVKDRNNISVESVTSHPRRMGMGIERLTTLYELIDISTNGSFHCMFANQTGTVSECNITAVRQNENGIKCEL